MHPCPRRHALGFLAALTHSIPIVQEARIRTLKRKTREVRRGGEPLAVALCLGLVRSYYSRLDLQPIILGRAHVHPPIRAQNTLQPILYLSKERPSNPGSIGRFYPPSKRRPLSAHILTHVFPALCPGYIRASHSLALSFVSHNISSMSQSTRGDLERGDNSGVCYLSL